mmetsp:Transcript_97087/g.175437  ORF Transcript_97087/g.175437 Transcript_97087/m.175437 type:complete len:198 (+) Transcript_97087:22-615(+)
MPWDSHSRVRPLGQSNDREPRLRSEPLRGSSLGTPGSLQTPTTPFTPYRLRVERGEEIQAAFDAFKAEGAEGIGYHELKAALRGLALPAKKVEVLETMRQHGCPPEGLVGFSQFSQILQKAFAEQDPLDSMLQSFRLFDRKGHGRISLQDLQRATRELGENISTEVLESMLSQFDVNHDGEIDEAEFVQVMNCTALQ